MSDVPTPHPGGRPARRGRRRTVAVVATAATVAAALGGALVVSLTVGTPAAQARALEPFDGCPALGDWYAGAARAALDEGGGWVGGAPLGEGEPGGVLRGDAALPEAAGEVAADARAAVPEGAADAPVAGELAGPDGVGTSESGTNVQEAGVDEPAPLKTDGRHVYAVAGRDLVVTRVAGADTRVAGRVELTTDIEAGVTELLLAGDRVVALTSSWVDLAESDDVPGGSAPGAGDEPVAGEEDPAALSLPVPIGSPTTVVTVVDVSDPADPRLVARDEVEGSYLSARATETDGRTPVRLVVAHTPMLPRVWPGAPGPGSEGPLDEAGAEERNREIVASVGDEQWLPQRVVRGDDGGVERAPLLDCGEVSHPDQGAGLGTLAVLTLDPGVDAGGELVVDRDAVSADGQNVYASTQRLYVATTAGGWTWGAWDDVGRGAEGVRTDLHGFDIAGPGAETTYVASASVDGWLLGRWALSSAGGHLRVATTTEELLPEGGPLPDADPDAPEAPDAPDEEVAEPVPLPRPLPATQSSIHVLAETEDGLDPVGRLDGLGPTETIRAVRWFGDLAVVVTFRQTDPLYTIDLSDPAQPEVLGELKVTGYSGYLHPVGDDRLLGIGQEATDEGIVTGGKAELYDLSDLAAPRDVASLVWPDESPTAERDSRRFSYLPERDLALLDLESWVTLPLEDTVGEPGAPGAPVPAVRGPAMVAVSVGDDGSLTESGRWWSSADPATWWREIQGHVALADAGLLAVSTVDWSGGDTDQSLTVLDLDGLSPVAEVELTS